MKALPGRRAEEHAGRAAVSGTVMNIASSPPLHPRRATRSGAPCAWKRSGGLEKFEIKLKQGMKDRIIRMNRRPDL